MPERDRGFNWSTTRPCASGHRGVLAALVRAGFAIAVLAAAATLRGPIATAQPLRSNQFALDFHRGPVQGPGRAVGLGGAFTALAEGVDGVGFNPAAYGRRPDRELAWFAPAFVLGVSFPRNNWDNSGTGGRDFVDFAIVDFGVGFNFGPLGVGYLAQVQGYTVAPQDATERTVSVNLAIHRVGVGYMIDGGALTLGAGVRIGAMGVGWDAPIFGTFVDNEVNYVGASPEIGLTWAPQGLDLRVGAAYRAEVVARTNAFDAGDGSVLRRPNGCVAQAPGCFVIPRSVNLPWEVDLGVAWRFSAAPFNAPWRDPRAARNALRDRIARDRVRRLRARGPDDGEGWDIAERARRQREDQELESFDWRYRAERLAALRDRPHRYLLVSAGLSVFGPTPRGQGIEGFIDQVEQPSGRVPVVSPRVGLETEVIDNRLRLRVGSYLEPSRFEDIGARVHGTAGFDLRLFRWNAFKIVDPIDLKLSGTFDVSYNYVDWGFSVGIWR